MISPEVRFWKYVEKRGPDECWPWIGGRHTPQGYGLLSIGRSRNIYAHRFAYELARGPIPDGLGALHTCDNPPCCNPAHLYAGTPKDNARDMRMRGRMKPARGEQHGSAKLTDDTVREIRRLYAAGGISHSQLAARFGVADSRIGQVVRNELWTHVT